MKIAITGTIASGKSMVKDYIINKGYHVFDCDFYNSQLLLKGNKGYEEIIKRYPSIGDEKGIVKSKLADLIFNNEEIKKEIENILHPLIINKMKEESAIFNPFFAEVPLLFETNLENLFDETVLIITSKKESINRLIQKGYTRKEALRRINSQMSIKEKKNRATKIIYNKGSLDELSDKVDNLLKELKC